MESELKTDGICFSKGKSADQKSFIIPFKSCVKSSDVEDDAYGTISESRTNLKNTKRSGGPKNTATYSAEPDQPRFCSMGLENECCRLVTFKNWPAEAQVDFQTLAKEGFYYVNRSDEVVCNFCVSRISGWQAGDNVAVKHKELYSPCPFIQGESNNVPLSRFIQHREENFDEGDGVPQYGDPDTSAPNMKNGTSIPLHQFALFGKTEGSCGSYSNPQISQQLPFDKESLSEKNRDTISLNTSIFIEVTSEPGCDVRRTASHPEYATERARLDSFSAWPDDNPMKIEDLATAGLFYVGIDDHTRCFFCGQGISNWQEGDDAWQEHGRLSPHCHFVKVCNGQALGNC